MKYEDIDYNHVSEVSDFILNKIDEETDHTPGLNRVIILDCLHKLEMARKIAFEITPK